MNIKSEVNESRPIKRKKTENDTSNRIRLSEKSMIKIKSWCEQMNHHVRAMIKIKESDILNTLIELHADQLSPVELSAIEKAKLTDRERIQWLYRRMKEMDKNGEVIEFQNLLKEIKLPAKDLAFSKRPLSSERKTLLKDDKNIETEKIKDAVLQVKEDI